MELWRSARSDAALSCVPRGGTDAYGAAVYTKTMLCVYDVMVLGLSLPFLWGCPLRDLLDLYNEHVGPAHLDVGVGTGYFLDQCRFPTTQPALALLDVNSNCLERSAHRLRRYAPKSHLADIRQPLPPGLGLFDSIALSMVLHCLPGGMTIKAEALGRLRPMLKRGGRLFGATILGDGIPSGPLSRAVMRAYNVKGILSNLGDGLPALEAAMARHFSEYTVHTRGLVALFVGRG